LADAVKRQKPGRHGTFSVLINGISREGDHRRRYGMEDRVQRSQGMDAPRPAIG
jgi:hypothetical protein